MGRHVISEMRGGNAFAFVTCCVFLHEFVYAGSGHDTEVHDVGATSTSAHGLKAGVKKAACAGACKARGEFGGGTCVKKKCQCEKSFQGPACDLGPMSCGGSAAMCLPQGIQQHKTLALSAAHLSNLVYSNKKQEHEKTCPGISKRMPTLKNMDCGSSGKKCATKLDWAVAHGSYGQIGGGKLYAVSFRGTTNLRDWITDGRLMGTVHEGFLQALQPHLDHIVQEVTKQMKGHSRLLITGHSLGGALANIFAVALKLAAPSIKLELITYGAPRVGDRTFQQRVQKSCDYILRVVNRDDEIPKTPTGLYAGFSSLGESDNDQKGWGHNLFKAFNMKGKKMVKTVKGAFKSIPVLHAGPQLTLGVQGKKQENALKEHHITTYIQQIQKLPGIDKSKSLCPK